MTHGAVGSGAWGYVGNSVDWGKVVCVRWRVAHSFSVSLSLFFKLRMKRDSRST